MARPHRYRAPGIIYVLSFLAFGLATTSAVLIARGFTIDLTSGAVYKTGLLIVRSQPSNAYVTVDNRLRKERTPARLQFRAGSYHVKIDKPGVKPFERTFAISAEHADFAENILLWRRSPDLRTISQGVTAQTVAAGRNQIAFMRVGTAGAELYLMSPDNQPALLATLPAAYAQPTTLTFNRDATVVLLSTPTSSVLVPVGGSPLTVPVGGDTAFLPGTRDTVVARQGSQVLLATSGSAPIPVASDVSAWAVTPDALYVSTTDGQVTRLESRGTVRKLVGHTPSLGELRGSAQSDTLFGRDQSGGLYSFDPKSDQAKLISPEVDEFAVAPNGAFVAFRSGQELRLWSRETNRTTLVSRFTTSFTAPQPTTTGHYLTFVQAGQLHAIAADGSNDVTLTEAGGSPLLFLGDDRLLRVRDGTLQLVRILDR